jgi:hypothetical protein
MDQGLYDSARQYQRNASDPKTLHAYYGHIMERMDEQNRINTARVEAIFDYEFITHLSARW